MTRKLKYRNHAYPIRCDIRTILFWLRRHKGAAVGLVLAGILLYPFESVVVPPWTLRIVDEQGNPVARIPVKYWWRHYSFERNDHVEEARTDNNGVVSFPQRTARGSLLARMLMPVLQWWPLNPHASLGPSGQIVVWGWPDRYETASVSYNGTQALSGQIMLRPPLRK